MPTPFYPLCPLGPSLIHSLIWSLLVPGTLPYDCPWESCEGEAWVREQQAGGGTSRHPLSSAGCSCTRMCVCVCQSIQVPP